MDVLAIHVVGTILKVYPAAVPTCNERWMNSDDIWLNRTTLLFQDQWKNATDQALLFANLDGLAVHPDLLIRKAIGLALRELGASDPVAVRRTKNCHGRPKLLPHGRNQMLVRGAAL